MEKYYTTKQAAEVLGKSQKTICRYAKTGKLQAERDTNSGQLLFSETVLRRYRANHFVDARDSRYIDSQQIRPAHQARGL